MEERCVPFADLRHALENAESCRSQPNGRWQVVGRDPNRDVLRLIVERTMTSWSSLCTEVTNEERETQVLPLWRSGSAPEEAASDSYRRRAQLQGLCSGAGLRFVWRGVLQRDCSR